jgi:hypothetical protein
MKRSSITIAALMLCLPAAAQQPSRPAVEQWLDGYGAAWESRDPAAAARLFTTDALYYETPWSEPFAGSGGIADYWMSVTADQRNVEFDYELIALNADTAVAHWTASFELASSGATLALDGVFVLTFESAQQVSELREWWVLRP